jgi:hypothetical protein
MTPAHGEKGSEEKALEKKPAPKLDVNHGTLGTK